MKKSTSAVKIRLSCCMVSNGNCGCEYSFEPLISTDAPSRKKTRDENCLQYRQDFRIINPRPEKMIFQADTVACSIPRRKRLQWKRRKSAKLLNFPLGKPGHVCNYCRIITFVYHSAGNFDTLLHSTFCAFCA